MSPLFDIVNVTVTIWPMSTCEGAMLIVPDKAAGLETLTKAVLKDAAKTVTPLLTSTPLACVLKARSQGLGPS